MTPGPFLQFVSKAVGLPLNHLIHLRTAMATMGVWESARHRGLHAKPVTVDQAASFLVALCAAHCGMTLNEAAQFVRANPKEVACAKEAFELCKGYGITIQNGDGDLIKRSSISPRAMSILGAAVNSPIYAAIPDDVELLTASSWR